MRSVRKRRSGIARRVFPRSWHQTLASLALIVFALQSYVTQTHIHLLAQGIARVHHATARLERAAHGTQNPFDNPDTCPICQDIALAGHFTTPAIAPVLPPAFAAVASAIFWVLPHVIAQPSHNWHGRAPPQH